MTDSSAPAAVTPTAAVFLIVASFGASDESGREVSFRWNQTASVYNFNLGNNLKHKLSLCALVKRIPMQALMQAGENIMQPGEFAANLVNELDSLPEMKVAPMRKVRRKFSRRLNGEDASYVLEAARSILKMRKHRWIAYELIQDHAAAFHSLDREKLEELGSGINSWGAVDCFARTLSGPAWRDGIISGDTIRDWAKSPDRWWRRAALVSTVALNVRSQGGTGDTKNTLAICEMLVEDHEDTIVKALSWALRELVVHDPIAVENFICFYEKALDARVKREVRNKLATGLKNP